jgi:hypothetical protein
MEQNIDLKLRKVKNFQFEIQVPINAREAMANGQEGSP